MKSNLLIIGFSLILFSCGSSNSNDSSTTGNSTSENATTENSSSDDKYSCDDQRTFQAGINEGRRNKGNSAFTCDYYWDLDKDQEFQGKTLGEGSKSCYCKGYDVGQNEQ
jgi:hypothetical protein